jgi:hypothetical protein
MSEETKINISETVELMRGLDQNSAIIVQSIAQALKARQDMDKALDAETAAKSTA